MLKIFSCFIICCSCCLFSVAQSTDVNLLKSINVHRNKKLDNTFATISSANNYVNFGKPTILAITGLATKNKTLQKNAALLFTAQIVASVTTQSSKRIIKRDRPFITHTFIQAHKFEDGYAMPSGHTSSAFANATMASMLYKKWYVVAPAYTYATLVGYSRMHLGVHYPSDVLVGALVGTGSAILTKWLEKKLFKKKSR